METSGQNLYTEEGYNREFLDSTERIEKGLKRERIPINETLTLLRQIITNHPEPPAQDNSKNDKPEDEIDECMILMEKIGDGIKDNWIPEIETIELLRGLNNKYPVGENNIPEIIYSNEKR